MADIYSEIRLDLRWIADYLEDQRFEYKSYNHGIQFNVKDKNGIIHSFYPTTGTALFHEKNERGGKVVTIRNLMLEAFLDYIRDPERIQRVLERRHE